MNLDPFDVEDHIENFTIRKPRNTPLNYAPKEKSTRQGKRIHECIPLLLADLSRSSAVPDHEGVFSVFNSPYSALHFRTCIVHVFVAGRGVFNKSFFRYFVDDGTASMEISIFKKTQEQNTITSLYNEASALSRSQISENDRKVSYSMMRLLSKAMEYVDGSKITPGSNVCLYGRPKIFREKVGLDAFSFCLDNAQSRHMEIAFNDNLIDWYNLHKIKE
ncbi:uncharacterized protein LOC115624618 [Scaptodrosophila lebanonensis]|uniref:Uncharacterized protein LOC115624618 n=1 Tax=Drosophila lebanonensis TaxID=7225 RepID=A0A6J2TJC1_DROLE|nr:uncharacterized protein LOC115624618 [Scaptodrosophila lebanonensis]